MSVSGTIDLKDLMPKNPTVAQTVAHHFALWWLRAFIDPKFDNGAMDRGNAMAQWFATAAAVQTVVPAENLRKFYEICSLLCARELERTKFFQLDVDYHPCTQLGQLMMDSGVPVSLAPWKTNASASIKYDGHEKGAVGVSHGYGAPLIMVYDGGKSEACAGQKAPES